MDQQRLHDLEHRCVQEEPPPCTAACPLHVDARSFVAHIQAGRWDRALKVLHQTMPLTGILGRICDGPCQQACNRKHAGGAIRIAGLERACVDRVLGQRRVMPLPRKPVRIAVAGSGLSSLTVAWDLARKGYGVTVLEPGEAVGEEIVDRHSGRISHPQVVGEIALLASLGVTFECLVRFDDESTCLRSLDDHDAVYVGLDTPAGDAWRGAMSAAVDRGGFPGETGREGVFAGGDHASPVWQAASGRWCATSMDRWLQRVSMSAGREKEGPLDTRLFTSLAGIEPLPAVVMADPAAGYTDAEAVGEAGRCLHCQCLECVKVCAYLEQFGGYPRKYAREIYNNASIVMGERKANRLINSCSLCGLCEAVCPNDFAMQNVCLEARRDMVARGKMPPSAHEFALQDLDFSQSDAFFMARHAPDTAASGHLFFPGCQLCASSPRQVTRVYDHLRENISGGVALMLGCCGAPAHWAGQEALFADELAKWESQWIGLGRPRPIMACSTCLRVFAEHLPEAGAVSLWEVLETTGIPDTDTRVPDGPLAVHDPCTTRGEPAVQAAVRRLLHCTGVSIEELTLGRDKTECCGFGGLMQAANPELSRDVADRRGKLSGSDFVAYCAMCRDNLAAVGKRTLHLLDLFFPDPQLSDPAGRPRPGWSRRRENRMRLKAYLCRDVWGEASTGEPEAVLPVLHIDSDVDAMLDARRILEEDIRTVIAHAEAGGPRFRHGESGHFLAVFRPYQATFWVEYALVEGGFRVHNAYAHRMEVLEP